MAYYSKEQIEQAKNADLADFVRSHGFDCEKVGREIHVKGYGGLYINPDKNLFSIFSRSKADGSPEGGKGPLAFAQKVMGMSFPEAMREIVGEGETVKAFTPKAQLPTEKKEFVIPQKYSDGYKNMYAYLINTRKISPVIVKEFANKGLIYPTMSEGVSKEGKAYKKINAVFLHENDRGQPCGADIQGLDSDPKYRFKGCTARDETDAGFVYTKGDPKKADTVYIFEAPIDLMSFVELHPEIENAKFAAISGLKPNIAKAYTESGLKVISCVDSDAAGKGFNDRILSEKMAEKLSADGGDITARTVTDREPPIRFFEAVMNEKECSFFLSKDDYRDAPAAKAEIKNSAFVWINKSNFTVCRECAEAGVKDFNELLQKQKGKCEKAFENIGKWSEKVKGTFEEKHKERNVETNRNNYERYCNMR